jgi:SAM-dependent methyltransferase
MAVDTLDECMRVAHARLYPSIFNPNYLVLRRRREIFLKWLGSLPGTGWRVLDIGGRYQPYRPLLDDRTKSYISIDVAATTLVDLIGRGEDLPFADETFDLVIATQVFDYFEWPHRAACEVHRVLKQGGHLLMSVPSFAPRFASEERWRFLPSGLRGLLSGFSSVEMVAEIGTVGNLFRILNLYLSMFSRPRWIKTVIEHSLVPIFNFAGWHLQRLLVRQDDDFAANYSVLATK